jgi:hypothetical protein
LSHSSNRLEPLYYFTEFLESIDYSLPEQQLHVLGFDFLSAVSTTVTTTLNFAMAFLINYPEMQIKMQQELDTVVGRYRLPTLDDRTRSVDRLKNVRGLAVVGSCYAEREAVTVMQSYSGGR